MNMLIRDLTEDDIAAALSLYQGMGFEAFEGIVYMKKFLKDV